MSFFANTTLRAQLITGVTMIVIKTLGQFLAELKTLSDNKVKSSMKKTIGLWNTRIKPREVHLVILFTRAVTLYIF